MSTPIWSTYLVHADKHDMIYLNASTVLLATDGGLYKTTNSLSTWTDIETTDGARCSFVLWYEASDTFSR